MPEMPGRARPVGRDGATGSYDGRCRSVAQTSGTGTAVLDIHGSTAELRAVKPPAPAEPPSKGRAAATMLEIPTNPAAPHAGTPSKGRAAATMLEIPTNPTAQSASTPSKGRAAATMLEIRTDPIASAAEPPKAPGASLPWVPLGIGAAAVVLLGAVVLVRGTSTPEASVKKPLVESPPEVVAPHRPIARNVPERSTSSASAPAPAPEPVPEPAREDRSRPATTPEPEPVALASRSVSPFNPTTHSPGPGPRQAEPAESKPDPTPTEENQAAAPVVDIEGGSIPDGKKPSERNVPLDQLLKNPLRYAGELITLEQVYCLGKTPWRRPDGSYRVAIVESLLGLTKNSQVNVKKGRQYELGLERRLADQLISLNVLSPARIEPPADPEWYNRPANLTLEVARTPPNDGETPPRGSSAWRSSKALTRSSSAASRNASPCIS